MTRCMTKAWPMPKSCARAGVKVTIADYADMVHCFIYLQTVLPQAHEAVADAAQAVAAALDAA